MLDFEFKFDQLEQGLKFAQTRIENLKPPLKEWAREKREDAKERIKSGDMPPLAPSTVLKRLHTGTSTVTKHGSTRKSVERRIEIEAKRFQARLAGANRRFLGLGRLISPPEGLRRDKERWRKKLESLNRQLVRAQDKEYSERKTGASQADRWKNRPLLGKVPSTLFTEVQQSSRHWLVLVASRWAKGSKAHNEGGSVGHGAQLPRRAYLVLTQADIENLKTKLVRWGLEPLQGGGA